MTHPSDSRSPAGTFVFADLAGYTALTARWGDDIAAEVAIALTDVATRLADEHGGRLVKSMGDSVMLRTDDPADAIRLGIGLAQRAPALRARVGIHAGPAVEHRGDYHGLAVNLAARLCAQAAPGEVLVSQPTWSAAGMRGCGAPAHAVALGPWILGDAPGPVEVLALATCGGLGSMSVPATQDAPIARAGLTGVVVFSEQRLVAEGLQALLRTAGGFAVPAVAGSLGHLLEAVSRLRPAAVLLDAGAGGPHGARTVLALRPLRPDVRIVVLADSLEPRLAGVVAAGHADALLPKMEASGRATVQAIRDVLSGRQVLSGWSSRTTPGTDAGTGRLSARQREVLRLVVAGYSNAQIAEELVISVNTVKFHVRTIFRELGIRSRVDAARRHGGLAVGVSAP